MAKPTAEVDMGGGHCTAALGLDIVISGNGFRFTASLLICFLWRGRERVLLSVSCCPGTQSAWIQSAHHHTLHHWLLFSASFADGLIVASGVTFE